MKPLFSREYYMKNWDRFIQRVPGDNYINMGEELERSMKPYAEAGLPDDALKVIEKMEAKRIMEKADKLVRSQMATLIAVENGKASFGYTTQFQEIEARANYRKRFDFNCLQLALFREKYGTA